MTKRKPKTLSKLSDDAATQLQLLVRLKASDDNGYVSCVTCGVTKHYKDQIHGGHFIERGYRATKLLEENIHPQCSGCNSFKHGNQVPYTLYMIDMYGREFVDELEILKHEPRVWDRESLNELIKELKERVRIEQQRVCAYG